MANKFTISVSGMFLGKKAKSMNSVSHILDVFREDTNRKFANACEKAAYLIEEEAKARIRKQEFLSPVKALANSTVTYKKKKYGEGRIFIANSFYVNNIEVESRRKSRRMFGKGSRTYRYNFTVMPKSVKTSTRGINLQDIVKWLEYGTVTQPARPFWTTTMVEAAESIIKSIKISGVDSVEFSV